MYEYWIVFIKSKWTEYYSDIWNNYLNNRKIRKEKKGEGEGERKKGNKAKVERDWLGCLQRVAKKWGRCDVKKDDNILVIYIHLYFK